MKYQICKKCIMDTSDPEITFDNEGVCCHCKEYKERAARDLHYNKEGQKELARIIEKIKEKGKGKKYNCLVGVSGGIDSTYLLYILKKWGLRPLAVHLDNGWDSELAVKNIEQILRKLNINLHTHVLDWEEFKDLQLSFLKSSIANAEIPTDHAIVALLYRAAVENGIKYIISGGNISTEAIMPESWMYDAKDWKIIKSIQKKFGKKKLKSFIHLNLFESFYYAFIKRIKYMPLLNYIKFDKEKIAEFLERELGWKNYGSKHCESIYTRFFQGYILPKKFNIDKRKAHFSTLINSGQMTREKAIEEMKSNPYSDERKMKEDRYYVIKKLGITEKEFEDIMNSPVKNYKDYPNNSLFFSNSSIFTKLARKLITR